MQSTNFNPLNKLKEASDKANFINKAKEQFEYKPFYDKYKSLYKLGLISKWFTPMFSVLTGGTFVYFMLSLQVHFIFAFIIGFGVVIGFEFLKAKSLHHTFHALFTDKHYIVFFSLFAGLICIGSIFLSVEGIKTLSTLKNSNDIQNNSTYYYEQKDSITNYYTSEIATAKNELQQFKKQASYRGQINIHNKAVKETILQSGNHIQSLRDNQTQELKTLTDDNEKLQILTVQLNDFDKTIFVWITAGIEVLIIGVHFWVMFFKYKVITQDNLINNSRQTKDYTLLDVQTLLNQFKTQDKPQVIPINESKNIGFGLAEPTDNKTSNKDIKGIIEALEAGIVDNRILCAYGFNPSQIKTLKKQYKPKTN